MAWTCGSRLNNHFLYYWLQANKPEFERIAMGNTIKTIGLPYFRQLRIPLPTFTEQEAIAGALSDADALIQSLEQFLAKKRQVKQGAMQELLTGKKRLPGFSGEWEVRQIAEIALPSTEKNSSAEQLPVLTCSKHLGFVNSLGYFKNQVFSRNTSGYKVIRRGQIGYPANHIEEGSIGLQDLYDVALVSPIYIVFSVTEGVNSYFLHRLLKLDSYRQKFETATTASIDRRGSLRWPVFSQIAVNLPCIEEQTAIAAVLSDMDAEIAALEAKPAKARQIKQGMMQELLTGRIRLV
jgi:type I restriction enzyme, S subunit